MAIAFGVGGKFLPTNEELVSHYLFKKAIEEPLSYERIILEHDLYGDEEPWDIFWRSNWNKNVSNCCSYTTLKKKKCKNQKFGKRFARTVGKGGTWSGVDSQPIRNQKGVLTGCKKNFVYEKRGSAQHGRWLMKEFSLDGVLLDHVKRLKQENEYLILSFSYKDLVICEIKWKDQGRNRARSGDGEVLQAEPVLNDQLGEYRYLNSEQIMQQATTSTIAVEPEVQSDELDKLNKDTDFLLAEQEQSIRPLERSPLMTSGFEVESLLPTVRYEDDIQSAESNLSIDMNELLNFLNLPSTSNVQDPVIESTDLSKRMAKNSAEENGIFK
ncbi:NAC domain-containing protein 2-like [Camellia sinensis]|uniref:NAC domain-containing protein 2-like n=1 Tax=Camellia sinensis TaxID=4442 RepID=UPI0010357EE0|nr:NAC domain-containing protein 2-like [Camellia sinensis]